MLEPLYTADEMRAAEEGQDLDLLMARAGKAVAEEAMRRFPDARSFGVVCGKGKNGGDGLVALEVLRAAGRQADEGLEGEVLIDALFGTGFHGEPREEAAETIEAINGAGVPVVSVDVPSGVDASTGEAPGAAVHATVTVTFHAEKLGLAVRPGRLLAGEVVVAGIGLSPGETRNARVLPEILELVPRKKATDTKYSAGSVLVVGGAPGLTGAACLAAEAAFRADAGYVAVAAPSQSLPVLESRLLEAVKRPLEEAHAAAERARALALGPGLGREPERQRLVRTLLGQTSLPAVVDADGLYKLEPFERTAPTVLTPHAGELAALLGEDAAWVDAHRLRAVERAVERFGCVCLLKGADTLVAAPGEGVLVVDLGPPSLAVAGTGDVLTGVIAAFLAKGLDARLAAAAGAVACALAASRGPGRGLVASDVVARLPDTLS